MRAMRLLMGVAIVGLIACGESAEDQCKEVADGLCDKFKECSKKTGDEALDVENKCLRALKPACEEAKQELPSIDDCLDAIKGTSCDEFEVGDGDFLPPTLRSCEVK
ncbi:MAG TPA: hypothetical protein VJV78_47305 [Polyangiales bacterium]|nr:hypothetical protein [Polyangiales bacterium]